MQGNVGRRDDVAESSPFVPDDFVVPPPPRSAHLWLEPLGPQHNEADYAAWTSSLEHIRSTPGFEGRSWPHEMSIEDNLGDLEMHARHFDDRVGFTYTVRDVADDDVVGCVYIYPSAEPGEDAQVRSWVRASKAGWDQELADLIAGWLREQWPFTTVRHR
jgi:hypothetical protein